MAADEGKAKGFQVRWYRRLSIQFVRAERKFCADFLIYYAYVLLYDCYDVQGTEQLSAEVR